MYVPEQPFVCPVDLSAERREGCAENRTRTRMRVGLSLHGYHY